MPIQRTKIALHYVAVVCRGFATLDAVDGVAFMISSPPIIKLIAACTGVTGFSFPGNRVSRVSLRGTAEHTIFASD